MNIFEIEKELSSIFDTLEENGGELTPELEEQLAISQDSFKDKVKGYVTHINSLKADIDTIKCEKERLSKLEESKTRIVDNLTSIVSTAITMFGDTNKSGGRFVDYGTGKVSVRNNVAVQTNDEGAKVAVNAIMDLYNFYDKLNAIDTIDACSIDDINSIIENYRSAYNKKSQIDGVDDNIDSIKVNSNDVEALDVEFNFKMPMSDILDEKGKAVLKSIIAYTNLVFAKPKFAKTSIKNAIKTGCNFELSNTKVNQSLIIR